MIKLLSLIRRAAPRAAVLILLGVILTGGSGCKRKTPEPSAAKKEGTSQPAEPELPTEESREPLEQPSTPEDLSAEMASGDEEPSPTEDPLQGNWTESRLIALTPTGPVLIDLMISMDGMDLSEASEQVYEKIRSQVLADLETPVTWDQLLKQPLVQSGWLGNLVAEEDQESQLIGMYDSDGDSEVDDEELPAFFSRGLVRNQPVLVRDIGAEPGTVGKSPWGEADANQDYALDLQELESLPQVIQRHDFDGDAILTAGELDLGQDQEGNNQTMRSSLVDTNSLITLTTSADEDRSSSKRRQQTRTLIEYYTYLEGIPREQWRSWSDERWEQLDKNQDQLLVRSEVEAIFDLTPDGKLAVRFPALHTADDVGDEANEMGASEESSESSMAMSMQARQDSSPEQVTELYAVFTDPASQTSSWHGTTGDSPTGQLVVGGCIANLEMDDSYTSDAKRVLRQQLGAALQQPQLQAFFVNQLQLKENAFELLDADANEELSDEEFERAWLWLSARQGTRTVCRWMTSSAPWFQLLDQDADSRISPRELEQGVERIAQLDVDQDQQLTPNELPLLVKLEVTRTDNRLARNLLGIPQGESQAGPDADWFSAMDTNRDGFVNKLEFLGENSDFSELDKDQDGFLHRSEVYISPTGE